MLRHMTAFSAMRLSSKEVCARKPAKCRRTYGAGGDWKVLVSALCDVDRVCRLTVFHSGCSFTPGAFRLRGLVNVMASDISGFRAHFSNYGSLGVDVAAPGTLIYAGTNYRPHSGNRRCTSCTQGTALWIAAFDGRAPNESTNEHLLKTIA